MTFEQWYQAIRLVLFAVAIWWIAGMVNNERLTKTNREWAAVLLAVACTFYGLVTGEILGMLIAAFFGFRTYQKKMENGHHEKPAQ